jgi:two-component system, NarL family, sensor histidine kinase DesK
MSEPSPSAPAPFRSWAARRRHLSWLVWGVWLVFLGYPVNDLAGRGLGPVATAAAGLAIAVFAAVYLRLMWLLRAAKAPLRRCVPWLCALAVLGLGLGLGFRGPWIALFIYVSVVCGLSLPMRWIPAAVTATTACSLVAQLATPVDGGWVQMTLNLFLVFFLGLMMVVYRRMLLVIAELRQAREELARLAVIEERLRIARDLHDLLGHTLSAVSLKSQVARRLARTDADAAIEQIAGIESIAQQALAEVREAVTGYRRRSLTGELDTARSLLAGAGVDLTVRTIGASPPAPADDLLAWLVREATTNVLKHARAHTCQITLRRSARAVTLEIVDDGAGPGDRAAGGGNGLVGMAERLAVAGGSLETGRGPGGGFRLTASLPLPATPGTGLDPAGTSPTKAATR